MNDRKRPDEAGRTHSPKRHKSEANSHRPHHTNRNNDNHSRSHSNHHASKHSYSHSSNHHSQFRHETFQPNPAISHALAMQALPATTSTSHYMRPVDGLSLTVGTDLPPLPPVKDEHRQASFRHKSHYNISREVAAGDVTYERLEFLGDAYLELFASRLLCGRYPHLPAGRMSQLRELLVKNETLAEYSRAYGFHQMVEVGGEVEIMVRDSHGKGNKGFNKILGDVFEAYVAAVVLSDFDAKGFDTAEQWCMALWAPKLLAAIGMDRSNQRSAINGKADLSAIYDMEAKAKLQKRICGAGLVRLHYEMDRPTVELKGDRIGQNVHYVALYAESAVFGIERRLLAKGEGKNKVEAGNWAAIKAMYNPATKDFIDELEEQVMCEREKKNEARKKTAQESKDSAADVKSVKEG